MPKIRQPGTFDEACNALGVVHGWDACAAAIERSPSLIKQFADDASPSLPNVAQAVKLDALHVKATGEDPPLITLMREKLAELVGGVKHDHATPAQLVCKLGKEVGDVFAAFNEAMEDGELSAREKAAILRQTADVKKIIAAIERAVKA